MKRKSGWFKESRRHSLASKGIKSAQRVNLCPTTPKPKERQVITTLDLNDAYKDAQESADEKFKQMLGQGNQFEVVSGQTGQRYGLLGACGFAWISFKGVKNKNMLEKAGIRVSKDHPSGFRIWSLPISAPQWAIDRHPDARAYYGQSVDLKETAMRSFLKSMQDKGFLKDAYVNSRLD